MMQRLARVLPAVAMAVAVTSTAAAQDPVPNPLPSVEAMPVRLGPLGLEPSVSLADVGVDDNVFNSADDPQSDFTATIIPRLLARLRMRRLLLSYDSRSDLVYFNRFRSERSANASSEVRLDADLGRLVPYLAGGWLSSSQRPNAELDLRTPRTVTHLATGARLFVASRTSVTVNARRQETRFTEGVTFQGNELARTLNSTLDSADGGLHVALTPLTSFSLVGGYQQDRFQRSPERDADSFRVVPALQFDPTGILRGSVAVGYRRFKPKAADLPEYSGLLVQTNFGYTLLGRTRFDLDLQRDLQYSFEEDEPYYLGQSARLTVTHLVFGTVDVQGIAGRQRLSYRAAAVEGESRRDRVDLVGAGLGFHLRERWRLSLNWESSRRESPLQDRHYRKQRVFAALTLGI